VIPDAEDPVVGSAPALRMRGVSKRFGSVLAVDAVDLEVPRGSFTALLGPSGCGKTTLLRIVAGLERADTGSVHLGTHAVDGAAGAVPPERRSVGLVFQEHALFPHLDVGSNVAFGLRGRSRTERSARVAEVLELVGLTGFERRRPSALSGGQRQRVALARALAPSPTLLLLDEPFSSLDAALRVSLRDEVRAILRAADQTALLVTHDQEEALSIADRIGVMFAGRLHQLADPPTLYREPATPEVASFIGDADVVPATRAGQFLIDTPLGRLATVGPVLAEHVVAVIRPESVRLRATADGRGEVRTITYFGRDQLIGVRLPDGTEVRARRGPELDLLRGSRVEVTIDGPAVTFPVDRGADGTDARAIVASASRSG
jgi:iron(III) transport system ATP-binding protein